MIKCIGRKISAKSVSNTPKTGLALAVAKQRNIFMLFKIYVFLYHRLLFTFRLLIDHSRANSSLIDFLVIFIKFNTNRTVQLLAGEGKYILIENLCFKFKVTLGSGNFGYRTSLSY